MDEFMTPEEGEKLIAKAIELYNQDKKHTASIIGETTPVTLGLVVVLVGFIISAIFYGQNLQQKMQDSSQELRKEVLIEIEKRFVQIQDVAGMKVQIDGIEAGQADIKNDIRDIKEKLDAVRIRSK